MEKEWENNNGPNQAQGPRNLQQKKVEISHVEAINMGI
jgi:hypothetical protein